MWDPMNPLPPSTSARKVLSFVLRNRRPMNPATRETQTYTLNHPGTQNLCLAPVKCKRRPESELTADMATKRDQPSHPAKRFRKLHLAMAFGRDRFKSDSPLGWL